MSDRIECSESVQSDYPDSLINGFSNSDWSKSSRAKGIIEETSPQATELLNSCPLDITIYSAGSDDSYVSDSIQEYAHGSSRPERSSSSSTVQRASKPSALDRSSNPSIQDSLTEKSFDGTGGLVEMTERDRDYARMLRGVRQKATEIVERNMTPAEMKQLREDMQKYKPVYQAWENQVKYWAGMNPPPQPERPASWVKYQSAVREQMAKLLKTDDRQGGGSVSSQETGVRSSESRRLDMGLTDFAAKSLNMHRQSFTQRNPNEQSGADAEAKAQKFKR